jgi:mevalonate kinase
MKNSLTNRTFHGKILLVGEHSVIDNSKALVIPYRQTGATLEFPGVHKQEPDMLQSNRVLQVFAGWLRDNPNQFRNMPSIDLEKLFRDIDRGLYFRSTIPTSYGVGSSGALCAALYYEYGIGENQHMAVLNQEDLIPAKIALSSMESYFHGSSSGVDPLCSYYDKPLVIEEHKITRWDRPDFGQPDIRVFLLDTGLTGNTHNLVEGFRKKMEEEDLKESFTKQYIPLVNEIVDQFVQGELTFEFLQELSAFQSRLFQEMIPGSFQPVWQYGLNSGYYACKLCGSGGGGYILGFTEDMSLTGERLMERFGLDLIPLNLFPD